MNTITLKARAFRRWLWMAILPKYARVPNTVVLTSPDVPKGSIGYTTDAAFSIDVIPYNGTAWIDGRAIDLRKPANVEFMGCWGGASFTVSPRQAHD